MLEILREFGRIFVVLQNKFSLTNKTTLKSAATLASMVFFIFKIMLTYTNIQHVFRKINGLSCNEYVLCDMIYFLSTNPKNTAGGWCYSKRETLADDLGLTKQGVLKMIDKLIEKGFIIKHDVTKFLRTTERWNAVYFENEPSVNKVYPTSEKSLPNDGKQSLPINNNNTNNKTNSSGETPAEQSPEVSFLSKSFKRWNKEEFSASIKAAREKRKAEPQKPNFATEMLTAFFAYWSEPDAAGKMRFQKQDTWATANRLVTWEHRNKN